MTTNSNKPELARPLAYTIAILPLFVFVFQFYQYVDTQQTSQARLTAQAINDLSSEFYSGDLSDLKASLILHQLSVIGEKAIPTIIEVSFELRSCRMAGFVEQTLVKIADNYENPRQILFDYLAAFRFRINMDLNNPPELADLKTSAMIVTLLLDSLGKQLDATQTQTAKSIVDEITVLLQQQKEQAADKQAYDDVLKALAGESCRRPGTP